jgi:putative membrane protein
MVSLSSEENGERPLDKVSSWLSPSLDLKGAMAIESAVLEAERRTSGEIVPLIVQSSTINALAPLLAALALGCLVLILKHGVWLYEHALGSQDIIWYVLFAIAVSSGFILGRSKVGQIWLTPRWEKRRQVQQRAQLAFYEAGLNQTAARTGILLFVSWRERQAVVLADRGIAQHCTPETFQNVIAELVRGARERRVGEGFVKAIGLCADILARHIPVGDGDRNENELHDRLRIVDED